jgi:alkaline phosphatase
MVEAASIDKQAHLMDSDRWILETIEFDRAIKKAQDFATTNPDTIVIVTADHECGGAAIIGAYSGGGAAKTSVLTYQDAKFPKYTINSDGYPASTDVSGKMLIGYGANADRYETWQSSPQPTQDSQQPFVASAPLNTFPANPNVRNSGTGFLVSGQVSGEQAVHTATDVPLSAFGRGASLFTGVFDNTDVFFKLGQIAVGGAK